jgi:hypothetical protein
VTLLKNNLEFLKHITMIYVNLITTVIKTIVAGKNNEALLCYGPSLYDLLQKMNGLTHLFVFLCVNLCAVPAGLNSWNAIILWSNCYANLLLMARYPSINYPKQNS